ncbi:glutathione synthase [Acidithiobacillus sp. CV18-2]|uniref:Glutathione synthetase n=1 Tax=Igneacidithiobacillus copahuensis TaxID=2724909 RepID=A0AAE2YNN3_9PROT|nr:glutathione synthase [Igneacidithiobacillus copahuensis]MBU2754523.1 glutathione synthase [Acidithiobacillus sp. CV18-3]MBU2758200.1 glutathione synthase [Acidithiobacillus sp. BN09-2]MBU2776359.1 glutathione synthase [Acidithiobacillus sp. CV18-2]MBU2797559.1 glutathione synthase [Acidithiobacillus sp. VAN18-2]MBU2800585.1 glutathione synthase [Acidithiobacillus sp. VAN18-4]UTV80743.1 glutathione synthase [Acidithiobacillus sp. YTS05]
MTMRVAVVMDPIAGIKPAKDSTFAMLLSAQARGHECWLCTLDGLSLRDGQAWGRLQPVQVWDNSERFFALGEALARPLRDFDCVLMRKDPPVDMDFLHACQILEHAGTWVVNDPASIRLANEKLFPLQFSRWLPPYLVSRDMAELRDFLQQHGEIVVKPLAARGGEGIFYLHAEDRNLGSILETITARGTHFVMAQRYLPAIRQGDKRILLVDGVAVPGAMLRIPAADDFRGNLVAGAQAVAAELSPAEQELCTEIGPVLREMGLLFVGIDVIGERLTEINVTSPTGAREIRRFFGIDATDLLWARIEQGR